MNRSKLINWSRGSPFSTFRPRAVGIYRKQNNQHRSQHDAQRETTAGYNNRVPFPSQPSHVTKNQYKSITSSNDFNQSSMHSDRFNKIFSRESGNFNGRRSDDFSFGTGRADRYSNMLSQSKEHQYHSRELRNNSTPKSQPGDEFDAEIEDDLEDDVEEGGQLNGNRENHQFSGNRHFHGNNHFNKNRKFSDDSQYDRNRPSSSNSNYRNYSNEPSRQAQFDSSNRRSYPNSINNSNRSTGYSSFNNSDKNTSYSPRGENYQRNGQFNNSDRQFNDSDRQFNNSEKQFNNSERQFNNSDRHFNSQFRNPQGRSSNSNNHHKYSQSEKQNERYPTNRSHSYQKNNQQSPDLYAQSSMSSLRIKQFWPPSVPRLHLAQWSNRWDDLKLPNSWTANLRSLLNSSECTTFQMDFFRAFFQGNDVFLRCGTGTGKSLAMLVAALAYAQKIIAAGGELASEGGPTVLIVVPTVPLAKQLYDWSLAISGMQPNSEECNRLVQLAIPQDTAVSTGTPNAHILIGVLSQFSHNITSTSSHFSLLDWTRARVLMLDEADRLLSIPGPPSTQQEMAAWLARPGKTVRWLEHMFTTYWLNNRPLLVASSATLSRESRVFISRLTGVSEKSGCSTLLSTEQAPASSRVKHICKSLYESSDVEKFASLFLDEVCDTIEQIVTEHEKQGKAAGVLFLNEHAGKQKIKEMLSDRGIGVEYVSDAFLNDRIERQAATDVDVKADELQATANIKNELIDSVESDQAESIESRSIPNHETPSIGSTNLENTQVLRDEDIEIIDSIIDINSSLNSAQLTSAIQYPPPADLYITSFSESYGLDIPNLSYVIVVGLPPSLNHYLHMSGRVGRLSSSNHDLTVTTIVATSSEKAQFLSMLANTNIRIEDAIEDELLRAANPTISE